MHGAEGKIKFCCNRNIRHNKAELKKQHSKVSMTASSPDALEIQEINQDVSSIFLPLKGRKDIAGGLGAPDYLRREEQCSTGKCYSFL